MSTLEVNKLAPLADNGTVTLGDSGDTITIPSGVTITNNGTQTGFGGENTPAFQAYLSSNQTGVNDAATTKVQFNTENYDTDNCYDNSTNYRFTPTVAGKYHVYSMVSCNSLTASNVSLYRISIYKNGSSIAESLHDNRNNANGFVGAEYVATTIDMNGSSDYLEVYCYQDNNNSDNNQRFQGSQAETYFGAYRIIGA
tara:strand:- start:1047 stop:1640 length:594 start_codon:yes stop_codon:yes gene_type:complete